MTQKPKEVRPGESLSQRIVMPEPLVKLFRAREALDEIISDPHMPDDLVLQCNATANKISELELRMALELSVQRGQVQGITIETDSAVPPGEVQVKQDGRLVARITNVGSARTLESDLQEDR